MFGIVGTISVPGYQKVYNSFSSLSVTVTRSGGGLYCHYNDTFTVLEKISNKYHKISTMYYAISRHRCLLGTDLAHSQL